MNFVLPTCRGQPALPPSLPEKQFWHFGTYKSSRRVCCCYCHALPRLAGGISVEYSWKCGATV